MANQEDMGVIVEDFIAKNPEIISEIETRLENFRGLLKTFVYENQGEFISDSLENTYKNIRTFAEVASAQYMTELSEVGSRISDELSGEINESINNYL